MLGLNLSEVMVIVFVLIIVVGPEKLPGLLRTAGRTYNKVRRMSDEFRRALMLEVDREEAEARAEQFRKRREEARRIADEARRSAGIEGPRPEDAPQPKPAAPAAPTPAPEPATQPATETEKT